MICGLLGLNSRFLVKSVSFCVLCLPLRVNFEKICVAIHRIQFVLKFTACHDLHLQGAQ